MSEKETARIRESIEAIEPRSGAKERMLANIKRKAAEQGAMPVTEPQKSKVIPINTFVRWALPVAACLAIAIIGVTSMKNPSSTASTENPNVEIANPFVPVRDASVFFDQLGIGLDAPEGAESVEYTIIDNEMANIDFVFAGNAYTLRASRQSGDFSGLYGVDAEREQIDASNNAVLMAIRSGDDIYRKIEWTDGDVRYVLINTDGAEPEQLKAVYTAVK